MPFNPIGDVGRTLRLLLLDGMGSWSVEDHQIALASPDRFDADEVGLSLHLYNLAENAHLANEHPTVPPGEEHEEDSLLLDLYYLVTAHPPNGETVTTSDTLEQHRMLSKAVQTFREHAVIDGSELEGSLAGHGPLYLSIDTDSADYVLDVWNSFKDTPHLPSVSYVVTPVVIETEPEEIAPRVVESTMDHFGVAGGSPEADR